MPENIPHAFSDKFYSISTAVLIAKRIILDGNQLDTDVFQSAEKLHLLMFYTVLKASWNCWKTNVLSTYGHDFFILMITT